MPSTFTTDPIGPRSVDEMLDVVYGRAATLHRRRTMQRAGAGIAAMVLAVVAALTLQGSDEGAHVRLVDDPKQEVAEEAAPPAGGPAGEGSPTTPDGSTPAAPSGGTDPKPGAVPAQGHTTTTVTTPPVDDPLPQVWQRVSDPTGDSTPRDWYFDITGAVMEYDAANRAVVFTTRYRTPDSATTGRQERYLQSEFHYDGDAYVVTVQESGDQLGEVRIDDEGECPGCTARFDDAAARLVVTVPVSVVNHAIGRKSDAAPLGAGARIDALIATSRLTSDSTFFADSAGQGAS